MEEILHKLISNLSIFLEAGGLWAYTFFDFLVVW